MRTYEGSFAGFERVMGWEGWGGFGNVFGKSGMGNDGLGVG